MEMDYIIISTVRANIYGNLGFLRSEKRLNVALTRARKGLILVGNPKCLAKRPGVFRDLISFYCSNGLIVNDPFKNCTIIKKEEIFDQDLLDNEEDYEEIIEEKKERNFHGLRKVKVIKKIKNEKPAPSIDINPKNLREYNQDQNKENKNINNNKKENNHEENNKNNNKVKNKKKEEKEVKVQPIQQKKKKKDKKIEENEDEKKEHEEKEDLKKKGNKKWRIKNLYNKKKNQEEKQEENKKNVKIEEEKNEEEINSGKKGRKNQAKQKNEKQGKKKKNEKK
jgi:hypothetical protein